ncbi:MAG: hypothetical protein JWM34_3770 [Ilumatobacteraceae bacterium]|nr:hypothetical protein [Ilumatobacteraceae bacterium]
MQLRLDHPRSCPTDWIGDPVLGRLSSMQNVIATVRELDGESDTVVHALLTRGPGDGIAAAVLIVGFIPFTISRCRGRQELIDELAGELAIVIGEFMARGVPSTDRRLVNLVVDRAWDRLRAGTRRSGRTVPVDPAEVTFSDESDWGDPERVAINRVVLNEFRDDLVRTATYRRPVVEAWNSAVVLVDRQNRTCSEQDRWKYARRQLRRRAWPDIAA